MKFKFDANQEFQLQAIEAITRLFEGQPRAPAHLTFAWEGLAVVANRLDLDERAILENLQAVQKQSGLPTDNTLQCIVARIDTPVGLKSVRFPNFSVEMETGTGKTYVYLRTMLELYWRYGLRKYIVVVPSVAIREGVLKTLESTEKHLRELYDNVPYRYYVYDSDNLLRVRQFSLSADVEIMVMTIDSFNKASNIIHHSIDRLQGETPIHLIQSARPVLVLDEPQNMESELRIKALSMLNPLFALRYSATHRNAYNLVYRLTPFEAYRQSLVKRIEVASVLKEDDRNQVFLRLDDVSREKKAFTARVAVHKLMKDGNVQQQVITIRPGDSLEEKTNRREYREFEVEEINYGEGTVLFTNGVELRKGEAIGADKDAIFKAQIRYTIEEHFRKQARLREANIKVLSLFFIDRVDNYAPQDGLIRRLFAQELAHLQERYAERDPYWKHVDPEAVQAAYFAKRRTKDGEILLEDSKNGDSDKDKEVYNLIMKDKERLLSFDEPVSFIFSHSALREGWDNPNIFQICTLNQTTSEVKKRQEIGRGVRLAVDQSGERVHSEKINILTVVANESYESYVAQLQTEIEEEYDIGEAPPKPVNARSRDVVRLRKEFTLKQEFKDLWERIKHKTRYVVRIDTERLISEVVRELDREEIKAPHVLITKVRVKLESDDALETIQMGAAKTTIDVTNRLLPNIVEIMKNLIEHASPPICLTRRTLLEIFRRSRNKRAAMENPQEFVTVATRIIRSKLSDQLVESIQYEKINAWYEMTQLDEEIESWQEYLIPAPHSVYDKVIYDSEIEREFVEGLEMRDDVKLYLKLPRWFTIPTPIGNYNPDWAIAMEERDEYGQSTNKPLLYLVRETKGTLNIHELRPDERRKVQCGEQHFIQALGVDYKLVTGASDLP